MCRVFITECPSARHLWKGGREPRLDRLPRGFCPALTAQECQGWPPTPAPGLKPSILQTPSWICFWIWLPRGPRTQGGAPAPEKAPADSPSSLRAPLKAYLGNTSLSPSPSISWTLAAQEPRRSSPCPLLPSFLLGGMIGVGSRL